MKKSLLTYFAFAALIAATASSCKSDDDDGGTPVVEASPIKTLTYDDGTDSEAYTFTYNTDKKVTSILDVYNGDVEGAETIAYDYSVANQVSVTKGDNDPMVWTLDPNGRVTKATDPYLQYYRYEYDANGFLTKVFEHYDDADHLKNQMTILNGNVTQILTFEDDGTTVKKTKNFFYTSGDNVNQYPQDNVIDSNWKSTGGFFGKPSAKLMDHAEYWNGSDESAKNTTTYSYTFDDKNRPSVVTKSGNGFSETYTLTY